MRRRYHHLVGNAVRFLFVAIAGLINLKLGLQTQSLFLAALFTLAIQTSEAAAGTFPLQYPDIPAWPIVSFAWIVPDLSSRSISRFPTAFCRK